MTTIVNNKITKHLTIFNLSEYFSFIILSIINVQNNAAVWALRQAGAVIFGKTITAELGGNHPGATKNPFDLSREFDLILDTRNF